MIVIIISAVKESESGTHTENTEKNYLCIMSFLAFVIFLLGVVLEVLMSESL